MAGTLTISGTVGNTATVSWDAYYPNTTDGTWIGGSLPYKPSQAEIHVHTNLNIEREEVKDMRGLFHVYAIDYKNDQVIAEAYIIAGDEAKAKMKALHKWNTVIADYDLDDLDIICVKLGNVRKKREVQKVEIVENE